MQVIKLDEAVELLKSGGFESIEKRTIKSKEDKAEFLARFNEKDFILQNDMLKLLDFPYGFADIYVIIKKTGYDVRLSIHYSDYKLYYGKKGFLKSQSEGTYNEIFEKLEAYKKYTERK